MDQTAIIWFSEEIEIFLKMSCISFMVHFGKWVLSKNLDPVSYVQ